MIYALCLLYNSQKSKSNPLTRKKISEINYISIHYKGLFAIFSGQLCFSLTFAVVGHYVEYGFAVRGEFLFAHTLYGQQLRLIARLGGGYGEQGLLMKHHEGRARNLGGLFFSP